MVRELAKWIVAFHQARGPLQTLVKRAACHLSNPQYVDSFRDFYEHDELVSRQPLSLALTASSFAYAGNWK